MGITKYIIAPYSGKRLGALYPYTYDPLISLRQRIKKNSKTNSDFFMQRKFINLGISLGSRSSNTKGNKRGGVSHIVALPITLKKYLKAKKEEELWKTQI